MPLQYNSPEGSKPSATVKEEVVQGQIRRYKHLQTIAKGSQHVSSPHLEKSLSSKSPHNLQRWETRAKTAVQDTGRSFIALASAINRIT